MSIRPFHGQDEEDEESDSDSEWVPEGQLGRRPKKERAPERRTRPLAPRELQRLHETLSSRSSKQLKRLVEGLCEVYPWIAEEVHAQLDGDDVDGE